MTFNNIQISTRLRVALGFILVLILLLAFEAQRQVESLWLQTTQLYNHPLTVRRAVGVFETAVTAIHRDMRSLALIAGDKQKTAKVLQEIEANKDLAFQQIAIMEERYLGPREDIANLRETLIAWNVIRDETIRLLHEGNTQEVIVRTTLGGVGNNQAQQLYEYTKKVETFAKNKADELYRNVTVLKEQLHRRLLIYICSILIFASIITYFIVAWIKKPLRTLTKAVNCFHNGDLAVRSGIVSNTEFGVLASAFDAMADALQTEMQIDEKLNTLSAIMLKQMEPYPFCKDLIVTLTQQTESRIGAIYLLNTQKNSFDHFASVGLDTHARASFSADACEGEFGTALATGEIQHIKAIPPSTVFTFATINGTFKPCEIITIPICTNQHTIALLSLASLHPYSDDTLRFLKNVWPTITARMNGLLLFQQIQDQSKRLEFQNQELEAQKNELSTQTNELTEMNAELDMQRRELEQASQLKSIFLANMSHELRTPLNSVIALSGVLSRRLAGKVPTEEYSYLDVIERNGKHLLELINDILDLSRIEAGREEVTRSSCVVAEIIDPIVSMLAPLANEKGIALVNRVDSQIPRLYSDPEKVRHIVQNLAANAIKFTDSGTVEISAEQKDNTLFIAVRDTGIGIPTEALERIFEAFRQADDSASRRHDGTGLGLTIARKYARMLEGDITVESTPQKGSTFTLWLPLTACPTNESHEHTPLYPRHQKTTDADLRAPVQGHKLLLVEDSEAIVIQMCDILREQGYHIRTAKNGIQALACIEEELPDAVILDLMMPEMDGFEMLKAIRGTEKTLALPVLILTARHVTKSELSFLTHNHISQFIRKGDIHREELLNAVAAMLAPAPQAMPVQALEPRRRHVTGKPTVLIIEDNPDNMRTLHALLNESCTVLTARDGSSGLTQAEAHAPDLILTDIALPGMDGFAVLTALRAHEHLQHIPVVAVTASAMKGDREKILARGFDAYISKPINVAELTQTLHQLLVSNGNTPHENTGD